MSITVNNILNFVSNIKTNGKRTKHFVNMNYIGPNAVKKNFNEPLKKIKFSPLDLNYF